MKSHSGLTAKAPVSWKWREKHNLEHTVSIPFLHLNKNMQFLPSFVEEAFLSPLCILGIFVEDQLTLYVCI